MRIGLLLAASMAACVSLPVLAQSDATLKDGPKPAIKTSNDAPPAMPVPGKTSFTADQAAKHMEKRGYNLVSHPLKDNQGIWYAEGQRPGKPTVMLMMDYQGNVYEGRGTDAEGADHRSAGPGGPPSSAAAPKPVSPQQH